MGVKKGDVVRLHYTIRTKDGKEFDSSSPGEPITFEVGRGEVILGVEEGVIGMEVGEKKEITISPGEGFGERNEEFIYKAPKDILQDLEAKRGDIIDLRAEDGRLVKAQVSHIDVDSVTFDLNHPLAGKTLKVEMEVVEVKV